MKNLFERETIDDKISVSDYIRASKEYTIENLKKSNLEQGVMKGAIDYINHTPAYVILLCETYNILTYDIGSRTRGKSAGRNDTESFRKRKLMEEVIIEYIKLKKYTDTTKKETIVCVTKLFNSLI